MALDFLVLFGIAMVAFAIWMLVDGSGRPAKDQPPEARCPGCGFDAMTHHTEYGGLHSHFDPQLQHHCTYCGRTRF